MTIKFLKPNTGKIAISLMVTLVFIFITHLVTSNACAYFGACINQKELENCSYSNFRFVMKCRCSCVSLSSIMMEYTFFIFLPFTITYFIYSIVQYLKENKKNILK